MPPSRPISMPQEFRVTTVSVGGIRVPVAEGGPAGAEAVVFLHGNPGSWHDWEALLPRVAKFARVVAPDMPGYGDADKPVDFDYSIRGYAALIGRLLKECGIGRAHLVMHDVGGQWGLAWAVDEPDMFAGATLINAGVLIDYRWHRFARIWRIPVLGALSMEMLTRGGYRSVIGRDNPGLRREQLDRLYDQLRDPATRRTVLRLYRATSYQHLAAPAGPLAKLDRPALVLWGSDDRYSPVEQAERQRQAFPHARVMRLEGRGHWPFLEDPDSVANEVVPFLREQTASR